MPTPHKPTDGSEPSWYDEYKESRIKAQAEPGPKKVTEIEAVECALADLIGAYQAHMEGNSNNHDWEAHLLSINELAEAFGLESEVPASLQPCN